MVFISHVAEDGGLAARLAAGLDAAGYTTWYYERDSLPGGSYLGQVMEAITFSTAMVVLVSPASLASWQVDKEVVQAHEHDVAFLPVLSQVGYEEMRSRKPEERRAS